MPDRPTLVEDLTLLRSCLSRGNTADFSETVRLAIQVADRLETRGIYAIGLEHFVRSPDPDNSPGAVTAIDSILRRLASARFAAQPAEERV